VISLKKVLLALFLFLLPLSSTLFTARAAPPIPSLVAVYSNTKPTIDGQLRTSEWKDSARYKFNVTGSQGEIETWMYIKHNGTHIHIGLLVRQIYINAYDEFAVYFEEGNDTINGSGSRDNVLGMNQEDLKACDGTNSTTDGYWASTWIGRSSEIDFDAKANHETDHAPAGYEIEAFEGLGFIDDHWECEFSIPLVGNDSGTTDLSDLVCSVEDTVGFKLQYFINPGAKNYFYPAGSTNDASNFADLKIMPPPEIESCNLDGTAKDEFASEETVYINGTGYAPMTNYDLYVVEDVADWTNGMWIPARVPDTATSITTDQYGAVAPTAIWNNPQTLGSYDIIIDVNGNGAYDAGRDVLDTNDVQLTAGFVVPELTTIMAMASLLMITLLIAAMKRARKIQ
jgi:hypothetical protein